MQDQGLEHALMRRISRRSRDRGARELLDSLLSDPAIRRIPPADLETLPLYGVVGYPLTHSLSPVMHNRAFSYTRQQGLYVALELSDIAGAIQGMRALGFSGASITIPHKEAVMAHLEEVDAEAARIGAVNTVVFRDGKLWGANTDSQGALRALKEKTTLENKTVVILGAGGAARAVAFGVAPEAKKLMIVNRSAKRGERLARELGVDFVPLEKYVEGAADILINTTPVGMAPRSGEMPVPLSVLDPAMVVMDIVYNPLKTALLQEAERIGCQTVDGVSMFVYQGARQFELWTGADAPIQTMRATVMKTLGEKGLSEETRKRS